MTKVETKIAEMDKLYAETRYYVWSIVKNASDSYSAPVTDTFVTLDMAEATLLTVTFDGNIRL